MANGRRLPSRSDQIFRSGTVISTALNLGHNIGRLERYKAAVNS